MAAAAHPHLFSGEYSAAWSLRLLQEGLVHNTSSSFTKLLSGHSNPVAVQLLFRSVHKLLMDTATSEYLFCSDFFQEAAVFHELFAPTLQVVESALAATLQVSLLHSALLATLVCWINLAL